VKPQHTLPAPAEIHWLTNIIGASAALAMIEAHGGTRVYVPKDINQNSAARLALGVCGCIAPGA